MAVPVITAQPTQQSAAVSNTATFSVTASGATSYVWNTVSGSVSAANLTSGLSNTAATSYTTASVTHTTGRPVFLSVCSRLVGGPIPASPTITGLGLTWTVVTAVSTSLTANDKTLTVFQGVGTGATGTITIDFGAVTQSQAVWVLDELTNTSPTAPVMKFVSALSDNGAGGTLSVSMGAFLSPRNATYVAAMDDDGTPAFGGGVTAIVTVGPTANGVEVGTAFNAGNVSTPSATSNVVASTSQIIIGMEIRPATPISGATSSSYTTSTLTAADNGTVYSVDCVNTDGTTVSANVYLFIIGESSGDGDKINSAWFFR